MRKTVGIIIYIFILLLGQVLLISPSFADEACDPSQQSCAGADSSQPEQETTSVTPSGGSSAGESASGGSDALYTDVDQRCWTKKDCEQTGFGKFVGPNVETKGACKMEKDASNNQIGFCLPASEAQMGLNWGEAGGQTSTFTHIGDFIKWIYKYGIVVAGVLAVMRIIAAGFDWVMSGGSQEKVTGAHKKIGGALMGLFLVLMAYSVLNLINPYLVNFRLPNIWMINTAGLVPPYCDAIKDKKFYLAKDASAEKYENTFETAMQQGFQSYDEIKPECGWEYYVEGAGGLTCGGTICDGGFCMPKDGGGSVCKSGMLGGSLGASSALLCSVLTGVSDLTSNIVDNNIKLIALCKDGSLEEVDDIDLPDSAREYVFPAKGNLESKCGAKENLAGFYIGAEINDEGGLVGSFCPGAWSSTGCDDWHAIGKSSPHSCDLNLAKFGFKAVFGEGLDCKADTKYSKYYCSCSGFADKPDAKHLAGNSSVIQSLISLDELQGGYYCNIEIDRSEFPAFDNYNYAAYMCAPDPTACF